MATGNTEEVRRKYKYVEDFVNPKTKKPYDDIESPREVDTPFGGKVMLHLIAKIKYVKQTIEVKNEDIVKEDGTVVEQPSEVKIVWETDRGEIGGYIQDYSNLAQDGECWVHPSAYVYQNAYVGGNAQVFGGASVFGYAKVTGEAQIRGEAGVAGFALVSGDAFVSGSKRKAVDGNARVMGRVIDDAEVYGDAFVDKKSEVSGKGSVLENAILIEGKVSGTVRGHALVYKGEVSEYGEVDGDARVKYGKVGKYSSATEMATVSGKLEESQVSGMAYICYKGNLRKSTADDNAFVNGSLTESSVDMMGLIGSGFSYSDNEYESDYFHIVRTNAKPDDIDNPRGASLGKSYAGGNVIIGDSSSLTDATVTDNAVVSSTSIVKATVGARYYETEDAPGNYGFVHIEKSSLTQGAYAVGNTLLKNASLRDSLARHASVQSGSLDKSRIIEAVLEGSLSQSGVLEASLVKGSASKGTVTESLLSGSVNDGSITDSTAFGKITAGISSSLITSGANAGYSDSLKVADMDYPGGHLDVIRVEDEDTDDSYGLVCFVKCDLSDD